MKSLIEKIRQNKPIQNAILSFLFLLIYMMRNQQNIYTAGAYILISFLIAYIAAYLFVDPYWKGFLYSLHVIVLVLIVYIAMTTFVPGIKELHLSAIMTLAGFLGTYLIGE
ncbi:hypothetical protein [Ectobacillus funiculus]|uniref:Uncharacterized protein n=1 Tax=Ectobacillus funiculus TaxID=137993 RepID=A0ABV5WB06_9BACI